MKIKSKMILPELRFYGFIAKLFLPYKNKKELYRLGRLSRVTKITRHRDCENLYFERADKSSLRVLKVGKGSACKKLPCVFWIHGGGFALGTPETDVFYIKEFNRASPCIGIMPDYTLSTEKPYPAAIDDVYLAFKRVYENADSLGIDREKIVIAGDSAGGSLACALSLRIRYEYKALSVIALYPMLDCTLSCESMKDNDAPMWNERANRSAWEIYLGDIKAADAPPFASPYAENDLSGLPYTYTYVGTLDPFYSETLNYFARMKECGTECDCDVFEGCYHAFDIFGTRSGKEAFEKLRRAYLKKL